ncbi:DUF6751 family protein [Anaerotignum sp.]|uniref:DUF6751 family protein n=1 Tax=Anaerotignum sp. TaxID=2039241 RepID=UPI00331834F1
MFPHNCTFYREVDGVWERFYIYGVLWQDVEGVNMMKSGMKDVNSLDLTIPFSACFKPQKKDLALKGIVDYQIQKKPSELFERGEVRTVTTVDTYDFGSLAHYRVGGK